MFVLLKMARPRRSAEENRDHILDVAHELFYWQGIRATGVDKVAAEAGVAPTVLYRSFESKDALVTAYMERAEARYREWFDEATTAATAETGTEKEEERSAAERIDSLFAALTQMTRPEVCRGCPFQMTLTELPDEEHGAHQSAIRLKKWVRTRLRKIASDHAAEHPRREIDAYELADHLTLLFEGVYATVQALGAQGPAKRARSLAQALMMK